MPSTPFPQTSAVSLDKHAKFSQGAGARAFFVSAKTGDQVASSALQIAADLAGVRLKKADVEQATRVVEAEIVEHPKAEPAPANKGSKGKKCVVQ